MKVHFLYCIITLSFLSLIKSQTFQQAISQAVNGSMTNIMGLGIVYPSGYNCGPSQVNNTPSNMNNCFTNSLAGWPCCFFNVTLIGSNALVCGGFPSNYTAGINQSLGASMAQSNVNFSMICPPPTTVSNSYSGLIEISFFILLLILLI